MRRLLMIITLWVLGLTAAAQPAYQLQYWVDRDFADRTVLTSANCIWQLEVDVASLHRGFHMLYMQVYDTSGYWQAPEAHLFYHTDIDSTVPSTMEYWFDDDYSTHQSVTAQGVHLLDVSALLDGFHTLSMRIGDGYSAQLQQALFYKAHPVDTSRSYEYWFDNQYATAQQGSIGIGGVMEFDVATLRDGFHTLYLRLGKGFSNELRSALFYKAPVASAADSTLSYWFDGVDSTMTTQPIGNGLVLLNVEELTDTTHTVYLILGNGRMAQLQSHEFMKVPVVYTVTLATDDSTMGSVSGGGDYPRNSTVNIAATAEYGYHFSHWSDGDTNALRSIYLTQDTALTAWFAPDTFNIDITQCGSTMGTVVVGGDGSYMGSDTATAVPNYGYHFTCWSDGDTSNPRVVTLTQDTVLTALFAPNIYTVTLVSDNPEWGNVIGSGEYEYLTVVPLEAVAVYGYQFKRWNDGNIDNPRQLVVRGDTSLTAEFELRRYTLTVNSNDLSRGFTQGGGTFSVLDTATVLAVTLAGNSFLGWDDGSMDNPRQIQLESDTTLIAIFQMLDDTPETIIVHDTTYVDVPYEVHDTTFVTLYDTVVETEYVEVLVHDTTIVTLYDTVVNIEYVEVPVHDTTVVTLYDTVVNTEYVEVPVHDTTIVTLYDTVVNIEYVEVPVHDTTIVTLTDTIVNTVYDTVINTVFDTVDNYVYDTTFLHDTTLVTDTLWLTQYDTIWMTDTIIIHDTIYVPENGIDDVQMVNIKLYQRDGQIVVEGDLMGEVRVYDAVGRQIGTPLSTLEMEGRYTFAVPASGVYLVKVGDMPTRRVVVVK